MKLPSTLNRLVDKFKTLSDDELDGEISELNGKAAPLRGALSAGLFRKRYHATLAAELERWRTELDVAAQYRRLVSDVHPLARAEARGALLYAWALSESPLSFVEWLHSLVDGQPGLLDMTPAEAQAELAKLDEELDKRERVAKYREFEAEQAEREREFAEKVERLGEQAAGSAGS